MLIEAAAASPASTDDRLVRATAQAGVRPAELEPTLPPRVLAQGTLRRLYETGLLLFADQGFHAVSVRDLTGALGMQPSALYTYVPSKQHLLAELLRAGHEEHRDSLRLALLDCGSDPLDQLAGLTRAHVRVHATYSLLTRLCNRELGSLREEDKDGVLAVRMDANRLFLDVVERGQRLSVFRPIDPMLVVAAIGGMGIRVAEWWRPDLGLSVDAVADQYAEFAQSIVR